MISGIRHLKGLSKMGTFKAPAGATNLQRQIVPGIEEAEVITAGWGTFQVEGQSVWCGPGTVLWFYPEDWIRVVAPLEDPYHCIYIQFSVEACPQPKVPRLSHWPDLRRVREFGDDLLRFYHAANDLEWLAVHAYSTLAIQARAHQAEAPDLPLVLRRAVAFLETSYAEPLQVETIAEHAGVSSSHLYGLFQRYLAVSPYEFLLRTRLQHARGLLVSTTASIKEICHASGFRDVVHFGRVFKQRQGVTPGMYRERHANPMGVDHI